jgi:integrase
MHPNANALHRTIAAIALDKLKPTHLDDWRKRLRQTPTRGGARKGQSRSDSALNRDMTALRAALNLAYANGFTTSDFAWRTKLTPVKNAHRRRDVYLDVGQRRKLLSEVPADLANLLRGLCLLPLRPGALVGLTVADFDEKLGTLRIGKDKAGKDRRISLPDTTKQFFAGLSRETGMRVTRQDEGRTHGQPFGDRPQDGLFRLSPGKMVQDADQRRGVEELRCGQGLHFTLHHLRSSVETE